MTNKEKTYWVHDTMMTDRYYRENHLNNGNGQYYRKPNNFNIKNLYDKESVKTALKAGTFLINGFAIATNPEHIQNVCEDFAEGRYLQGIAKVAFPYVAPYIISYRSRKKAKKESEGRINELERKIEEMTK